MKRSRSDDEDKVEMQETSRRRVCFAAPNTIPDYDSASEAQKEYGFITDDDGKMSDGTEGYFIW